MDLPPHATGDKERDDVKDVKDCGYRERKPAKSSWPVNGRLEPERQAVGGQSTQEVYEYLSTIALRPDNDARGSPVTSASEGAGTTS